MNFQRFFDRIVPYCCVHSLLQESNEYSTPIGNRWEQTFVRKVSDALRIATNENDHTPLEKLWKECDQFQNAVVYGELILLLSHIPKSNPGADALAKWAYDHQNAFCGKLLESILEEGIDEDKKNLAMLMREWTLVASRCFEKLLTFDQRSHTLFVRAQLSIFGCPERHALVGEAAVAAIDDLVAVGKQEIASTICTSVCKDLAPFAEFDDVEEIEPEDWRSVYWLTKACGWAQRLGSEEFVELLPKATGILNQYADPIDLSKEVPRCGVALIGYQDFDIWLSDFFDLLGETEECFDGSEELKLKWDYGLSQDDVIVLNSLLDSFLNEIPIASMLGFESIFLGREEVVESVLKEKKESYENS